MQKISNRNKENRKKQTIGHIAGTKAFARISYDSRDLETGNGLSRTKLWFTTRFSGKKGTWVDSSSQEVYDKLKKPESQPLEEGIPPMTEDERFEAVLGPERSSYICGRGAGPKPTTCTAGQRIHAQLERENEEFRRRAEEDRRLFEEMEKEKREMALRLESLESQVASQQAQMHEVQASVKSQFITLFQQFKDSGQIPM